MTLLAIVDEHTLLVQKRSGDTDNLWYINLDNEEQKQLTFGSISAAIEHKQDIYFQYTNQPGLWELPKQSDQARLLTKDLAQNRKLLFVEDQGIYYVSGETCREQGINYFDFATKESSAFLEAQHKKVSIHSFDPKHGALFTHCQSAESDILVLE
jgi:hypothetical protein